MVQKFFGVGSMAYFIAEALFSVTYLANYWIVYIFAKSDTVHYEKAATLLDDQNSIYIAATVLTGLFFVLPVICWTCQHGWRSNTLPTPDQGLAEAGGIELLHY